MRNKIKRVVSLLAVAIFLISLASATTTTLNLSDATSYINVTNEDDYFIHLSVSDPDVKLLMPFNEAPNGTKAYDYTNNSNDGYLLGGVIWNSTGGEDGSGAYEFDGVDSGITISDDFSLKTPSISILNSFMSNNVLVDKKMIVKYGTGWTNDQYILGHGSGNLYTEIGINGSRLELSGSSGAISNGNWFDYSVTYNNQTGKVKNFRDGINVLNSSTSGNLNNVSTVNLTIGKRLPNSFQFNGTEDNIIIFGVSKEDEISQINNGTYQFYYKTGEVRYENINLGANNKLNITLNNYTLADETYFQAKINDGDFQNFTAGQITDYDISGGISNLTLRVISNEYGSETPLMYNDIEVSSYYVDEYSPTYSNILVSNNRSSTPATFSITTNDDTALQPSGQLIFSTNNSGEWVNYTSNFTTTPQTIQNTITLNSTVGTSISYQWFMTDNLGHENQTELFNLTTDYPTWINPHPFNATKSCFGYNYLNPPSWSNCTR